jgi:hypothetical protein
LREGARKSASFCIDLADNLIMQQNPAVVGHCVGCEYDLRGLAAGVCPECGRPFDPADLRTFKSVHMPRPRRLTRWVMTTPGWPLSILAAFISLHVLWTARFPGIAAHRGEGALAIGFCVSRFIAAIALRDAFGRETHLRREWPRFAFPIALIALALIAAQFTASLAMRLGQPALERLAQHAMDNRNQPGSSSGWAGVYYIQNVVFDGSPYYPEAGTAQLICSDGDAVFVIEGVHAGNSPWQHGKSYWRPGRWVSFSVE